MNGPLPHPPPREGRNLPPLAVALVAAVLVHVLWLSFSHLRGSRQPVPRPLNARDDTPELLRFSRRPAEEPLIGPIPLPPASTLPPPPNLLSGLPERAPRVPPGGKPARSAQGRNPRTNSPRTTSSRTTAFRPARPAAISAARPAGKPGGESPAAEARGEAKGAGGGSLRSEGEAASTRLEALRRMAAAPASDSPPPPGAGAELLRPEGLAAQSWQRLWESAQPAENPRPAVFADLPETADLRRVPLTQARAAGLSPGHRQGVALEQNVLMLWVEGPTLWLVRTPLG